MVPPPWWVDQLQWPMDRFHSIENVLMNLLYKSDWKYPRISIITLESGYTYTLYLSIVTCFYHFHLCRWHSRRSKYASKEYHIKIGGCISKFNFMERNQSWCNNRCWWIWWVYFDNLAGYLCLNIMNGQKFRQTLWRPIVSGWGLCGCWHGKEKKHGRE